jgi:hypothetical protein
VAKDHLQVFHFDCRRHSEHAVTVKTAVRALDVTVRVESPKIAKSLDGNHRFRRGSTLRHRLLKEPSQTLPGAPAQTGKQTSVVKEVPAKKFGMLLEPNAGGKLQI